jgi:hypothetical protein
MTEELEGRLFDLEKRLSWLCADVEKAVRELSEWRRLYTNHMEGVNGTLDDLLRRVRELERR